MTFSCFLGSCQKESLSDSQDIINLKANENPHAEFLRKQKQENTITIRSGGKYSVNDAIEVMNDGMNYLYCRPNDYFLETVVFKDTFTVQIDGSSEIDEADLIALMDDIAEFAGDNYHGDVRTEKAPLIFDMNQVFPASSGTARIAATFAMEAGLPPDATDTYVYQDSWIYGQWGQDVSSYCSEEEANFDAADLFRRDLRENLAYRNKFEAYYFKNPYVYCFSGHSNNCFAEEIPGVYFPADEFMEGFDLINENDVTEDDNLLDYLLFYNSSALSGYHTCLSSTEMNFHYESMEDLALGVLPTPAGTSVIAQIEVGYDALFSGTTTIFHSMLVVKATKVTNIAQEDEDAIILPCCP